MKGKKVSAKGNGGHRVLQFNQNNTEFLNAALRSASFLSLTLSCPYVRCHWEKKKKQTNCYFPGRADFVSSLIFGSSMKRVRARFETLCRSPEKSLGARDDARPASLPSQMAAVPSKPRRVRAVRHNDGGLSGSTLRLIKTLHDLRLRQLDFFFFLQKDY